MENISKELLSEVLGEEVTEIKGMCEFEKDELEYFIKDTEYSQFYSRINIYKLAHKCKEWASNKVNYRIMSYAVEGGGNSSLSKIDEYFTLVRFRENSEAEAIFKACQWILDNKDR